MPTSNRKTLASGPALVTLLAIQILVGYEWLSSGITKVASGDFASGLAADLKDESGDAAHWYRTFLNDSIIPHGHTFGVLIEIGEIAVGVGFIVAAILFLTRWTQLSDRWRMAILGTTMLAALGATFMTINFHLASGDNHPWLITADGFDETIDVDTVLALIQAGFFIFSGYVLLKIRREQRATIEQAGVQGAIAADGRPGCRAWVVDHEGRRGGRSERSHVYEALPVRRRGGAARQRSSDCRLVHAQQCSRPSRRRCRRSMGGRCLRIGS